MNEKELKSLRKAESKLRERILVRIRKLFDHYDKYPWRRMRWYHKPYFWALVKAEMFCREYLGSKP
jgi:hypothetical protein